MAFVLRTKLQKIAIKLLDMVFSQGNMFTRRKAQLHDHRMHRDFLLIKRIKLLNLKAIKE
jgi:hypothetical protein